MYEFKKGDIVKLIKLEVGWEDDCNPLGMKGKIIGIGTYSQFPIDILFENGMRNCYSSKHLKLIESKKIKQFGIVDFCTTNYKGGG